MCPCGLGEHLSADRRSSQTREPNVVCSDKKGAKKRRQETRCGRRVFEWEGGAFTPQSTALMDTLSSYKDNGLKEESPFTKSTSGLIKVEDQAVCFPLSCRQLTSPWHFSSGILHCHCYYIRSTLTVVNTLEDPNVALQHLSFV